MNSVHVILKVTEKCNLRCKYCYNSETGYKNEILPIEYFEKLLTVLMKKYNQVKVVWHGGEPLCAGIDYFKAAMETEKKLSFRMEVPVQNSIQTNGTLINTEWAGFFKKHDFAVGISFDGINNDKYRQSGAKTQEAFDIMRSEGAKFGCLAVVADDDYDILKNYRFFAEKQIPVDFNYLFPEGAAKDLPGTGVHAFAKKMNDFFDVWLFDRNGIDVRTFSFYINMSLGGSARICSQASCHTKYIGISPDGELHNCGRASISAYSFGNIRDVESTGDIFSSQGAMDLIRGSIERRNKCRQSCEFYDICQGGCADCAAWDKGLENIPETTCILFRTVYSHVRDRFRSIMEEHIPLSELNPAVKRILSGKYIRFDPSVMDELAAEYIQL